MKANIRLSRQWSFATGISLMALLLSLMMVSESEAKGGGYCNGWQREVCNQTLMPVTLQVVRNIMGGIWVGVGTIDQSSVAIGLNQCGAYSLHTTGGDGATGMADLSITTTAGVCKFTVEGYCSMNNPKLRNKQGKCDNVFFDDGDWGKIGIR